MITVAIYCDFINILIKFMLRWPLLYKSNILYTKTQHYSILKVRYNKKAVKSFRGNTQRVGYNPSFGCNEKHAKKVNRKPKAKDPGNGFGPWITESDRDTHTIPDIRFSYV